jgi:hypothetical protein
MLTNLPLEEMSLEEKFMTMEKIWDDIIHNSPNFPSPSWHKNILDERDANIASGEDELIDWETAKEQLSRLHK